MTKDPSVKSEVAGALVILCVAFSLSSVAVVCVSSHPMMTVSRVFKAFLTDCVTKDASVKSEVACALALVILCLAFSLIYCRVVCVSCHPKMTVSRVFKAF